jgi:predicted Zn-dependent protease
VDLAALHLAMGRERKAERSLLRSLLSHPREAALWSAAAEVAIEGGRLAVARDRLRHALRSDPRHGPALGLLVRWLLESGQPARAANAGRAAVRVVPTGDRSVRDLGASLVLVGRPEEAVLHLRRYVLAAPHDPLGYGVLAQALEGAGDGAGATLQRRLAQATDEVARVAGAESRRT